MNKEELNKVRVKNEPICDSQSIPDTKEAISSDDQPNKRKRQSMKVKEEPIESKEMQTSKSEAEVKEEEKFSTTEEFASIHRRIKFMIE